MGKTIYINSLNEIGTSAKEFIEYASSSPLQSNIFAFFGHMGAGKTTFIKAVCEAMGVEDAINSPTFAIVNEYEDAESNTIFHFDFYRIKSIAEVYNMGYEEYLYSNAYCFMEWPELVEELLPEECIRVEIEENEDSTRTVKIITAE